MKCTICVAYLFLMTVPNSMTACVDPKLKKELHALGEEIQGLKTLHVTDVTRLKDELEELRQQLSRVIRQRSLAPDQIPPLQVRDSADSTTNRELNTIRIETNTKKSEDPFPGSYNEVVEDAWEKHAHHLRHQKIMSNHLNRIFHEQELLKQRQDAIQEQVVDVQNRLYHTQEANWNLLSAKVEILELESKLLRDEVQNGSRKISNFDKLHASMLELREEVESIENKADETIPEIRKEISKLDIDYAKLTAQCSYLREGQENLRQSVKAIAVSVSNAVDRAEEDRLAMQRLNGSLGELDKRSRHHFYALKDHILKSEANHSLNQTKAKPLLELMGEVKELQPVEREYQELVQQLPRDCSHVAGPAGVYLIRPGRAPVEAWCVNGSTVLQRRANGTVDFNRNFAEYVRGFGAANFEFWLGLDNVHRLSADNCSSMRIDMTDIYGGIWYAQYEHFSVGDADSGFLLEVSGFEGNASDAFEYHNHMEFSAKDRDRDISNTHCAANYEGGWWFSHCQHVNINGKYTLGLTWFDSARNEWIAVASTEMRLYRRPGCA